MSDRVNQIQEALDNEDLIQSFLNVADGKAIVAAASLLVITDAARDYADLLTRLEDGSAYEAAYVAYRDSSLIGGDKAWLREAVDAALGLQEDTDD